MKVFGEAGVQTKISSTRKAMGCGKSLKNYPNIKKSADYSGCAQKELFNAVGQLAYRILA